MSYRIYTTLGLAIVYALTALIGFLLQRPDWAVTLVWPPAGVALAAVLLLGRLALPGIFLGALATNLIALPAATQSSLIDLQSAAALRTLGVALIISATSTLAAQVAATGLQRVVPGAPFWNSAAELYLGDRRDRSRLHHLRQRRHRGPLYSRSATCAYFTRGLGHVVGSQFAAAWLYSHRSSTWPYDPGPRTRSNRRKVQ